MATKAQYHAATKILEAIDAVSDEGGVIQAEDMLSLSNRGIIDNDPRLHTTTLYARACRAAGLEQDNDGEWYVANNANCHDCGKPGIKSDHAGEGMIAASKHAGGQGVCDDCETERDEAAKALAVGDRVEAGITDDDHDEGRVLEISGERALVGWSGSNERTWSPISTLTRL